LLLELNPLFGIDICFSMNKFALTTPRMTSVKSIYNILGVKAVLFILLFMFHFACKVWGIEPTESYRERIPINENWKFIKSDVRGAQATGFNDRNWRNVNLPHDWSIEGTFDPNAQTGGGGGYLPTGVGWYRKDLILDNLESRNFWVEFGGVYMDSEIWVNGHSAGKNVNGYTSFNINITPFVKKGKNTIAVRVNNANQTNSRWYSGSGIYRNVWLNIANNVHIPQWGTWLITPEVDSTKAVVFVNTKIQNSLQIVKQGTLVSRIIDPHGELVAEMKTPVALKPENQEEFIQHMRVSKPNLWSVRNPALYALQTRVYIDGKLVDNIITSFGIRSIEWCADKGFLLNGEQVKLKGVNLHHDAGCLGAAVPDQVWERRLKILKDMGVNAIRTAHKPMSTEFMNLCDRLGLLVMNELFDEWTISKGKTTSAYHKYFDENWEKDVINFVHRDRNHPSVVIWSAGNEIREQLDLRGHEVLEQLLNLFHREDPTRPVTVGNDQIAGEGPVGTFLKFLEIQDVVGYNYVARWGKRGELFYTIDKMNNPHWKMVGTEYTSARIGRNEFSLGEDMSVVVPNYNTGLIDAAKHMKYSALHDFVAGDFMWTGIDFLGESTWPRRSSRSGVLDLAGFPKSAYYFYQSLWTQTPMMHVLPHWNWPGREGQVIPVLVLTNCDVVELFVNGKSYGEKRKQFPSFGMVEQWGNYDKPRVNPTTDDLWLSWDVIYEPGQIVAVGKENGKPIITEIVKTTGLPAGLRVTADKDTLRANRQDVVHVQVEIVDDNGLIIPNANHEIHFMIKGDVRLLGLENGDRYSHDTGHFKHLNKDIKASRMAYNGLLLAYVQAESKQGEAIIEIDSPGLKGTRVIVILN
jgi:beta-galactosidase